VLSKPEGPCKWDREQLCLVIVHASNCRIFFHINHESNDAPNVFKSSYSFAIIIIRLTIISALGSVFSVSEHLKVSMRTFLKNECLVSLSYMMHVCTYIHHDTSQQVVDEKHLLPIIIAQRRCAPSTMPPEKNRRSPPSHQDTITQTIVEVDQRETKIRSG
jgi:hypothetical protein